MTWVPISWKIERDDKFSDLRIDLVHQLRGPDKYAVRRGSSVLSKEGEWEYELQPSSRDEEFLNRCRFDTFDEAAQAYEKVI
jgi:hypothetical protein